MNMVQKYNDIILEQLPYERPFLFVDEIVEVTENKCVGKYTYREDEFFYRGHFKDNPVTPGVILVETMAQIGLVCLGMYIKSRQNGSMDDSFVFSSSDVRFTGPVYPGETVKVYSEKQYFRMGKLKCKVEMFDSAGNRVCKGELSGFLAKI